MAGTEFIDFSRTSVKREKTAHRFEDILSKNAQTENHTKQTKFTRLGALGRTLLRVNLRDLYHYTVKKLDIIFSFKLLQLIFKSL